MFIINAKADLIIAVSITLICIWQIGLGLMQILSTRISYSEVIKNYNGNFTNSNLLNCLTGITIPILLFLVFRSKAKWVKVFFQIMILLFLMTILFTFSRGTIIACVIGYFIFSIRSNKVNRKFSIFSSVVFIMIISCSFLISIKENSLNGRLLIWKVSLNAAIKKPFLGYGADSFFTQYLSIQGNYFKYSSFSPKDVLLADSTQYAFNEVIQIFYEYGLVGLFLFVIVFYLFFFVKSPFEFTRYLKYSVLILLICSFFSYTLHSLPVLILLSFCLGRVANDDIKVVELVGRNSKIILVITFLLQLVFCHFLLKERNDVIKWKDAVDEAFYTGQINVNYELYNSLKWNPSFLLWYGQSLISAKPCQAIDILTKLKNDYKRYDLFMSLGSAFEQIKVYDKAIEEYIIASYMIPNRFEPNFRIFQCYKTSGDNTSAKNYAEKILQMQEKIPSEYIKRIKAETLLFLKSFP